MLEGIIPRSKSDKLPLRDGKSIFYRKWEGKRQKEVIVYLHGIESHSGWFLDLGNLLNKKGFNVYGVDRRGSGMNRSDRGHIENYRVLIDDVKEAVELSRSEYPGSRIYLAGLCWGAKLAVTFTHFYQDLIDGLILITPAIKCKADFSLKRKLDIAYKSIFQPRRFFDIPLEDHMFTENPKYLEFMRKDELKLKKATARFFLESAKMDIGFDKIAPEIRIPVLVLLAGGDVIIYNEGIKNWFSKLGSADKIMKIYHGRPHGIFFEEVKNISDYITDWVKKH